VRAETKERRRNTTQRRQAQHRQRQTGETARKKKEGLSCLSRTTKTKKSSGQVTLPEGSGKSYTLRRKGKKTDILWLETKIYYVLHIEN